MAFISLAVDRGGSENITAVQEGEAAVEQGVGQSTLRRFIVDHRRAGHDAQPFFFQPCRCGTALFHGAFRNLVHPGFVWEKVCEAGSFEEMGG